MAQKSASRSGSGKTTAKKPSSSARSTGTKKSGASAGKTAPKSTARTSSGSRSASQTRDRRAEAADRAMQEQARELRRQLGAFILLFLGVVAVISLFPTDGWLVAAYRAFFRGILGWGYFVTPVVFLWAMAILWLHKEGPVRPRILCVLLLPVVFGAFVHVVACGREGIFQPGLGYGFGQLWKLGQDMIEHCGGVVAGTIAIVLRRSISVVGAFVVLLAAFLLMAVRGANITPLQLWELIREQHRLMNDEDEPEEDPDAEALEDELFALEHARQPALSKGRSRAEAKKPAAQKEEKAPARRRVYDEDWEKEKDRLFADMGVDKAAEWRLAQAVEEERSASKRRASGTRTAAPKEELFQAETPKSAKKPAETRPAPEKTAKPAPETREVEPLSVEEAAQLAGVEIQSADMDEGAAGPAVKKEKIDRDAEAAAVAQQIEQAEEDKPEYIFPEISLLNKSDPNKQAQADSEDENETRLQGAIQSFGVGAVITGAIHGPTVTRYELRLDQGVKLSKITNLQDDIALAIGAASVRIAPIPNKISTVGVEVPNRDKATVWLGDVIDSEAFRSAKSKLSVALGKDIGGNVIVGNISKMPHVLIAGTTGSGKSVCINSLILSILYKSTPDEVRMIMVDPKQVELGIYNGMPHLYVPVVTDAKKAAGALQWSVVEMLKRYRLFSEVGVRDIAGYNAVLTANEQPILPQVVIIIDELADLMMVAAKEVEESICRVAQMGRAAGMHLVVATQSPRADVITGLMKANIPSRIAFAVSGALESRIIMDQQGAEKLLGQGDMLYKPIGVSKPLRVQGAFVTDEEREEIINFVKREAEAEYSDEILAEIEKAAVKDEKKGGRDEEEDAGPKNDYDELLPQAVDVIFETKQASVSMLQRRLKLGYSRAARLIDQLEEVGVVGPYEGSKPRQILLTKQQWQEMQYSQGTAPVDTIAQEFAAVSGDESFAAPAEEDEEPDLLPEDHAEPEEEDGDEDDAPWEEDEL